MNSLRGSQERLQSRYQVYSHHKKFPLKDGNNPKHMVYNPFFMKFRNLLILINVKAVYVDNAFVLYLGMGFAFKLQIFIVVTLFKLAKL